MAAPPSTVLNTFDLRVSDIENYDVGRAIVEGMRPPRLVHLYRGGTALCAQCREINVQNLSASEGYQHVSNPRDMVESAQSCPLCERFILRPSGATHWMDHQAAIGAISCSLVGPAGFKRLVLITENWIAQRNSTLTGKLLDLPLFADAGDPAAAYGVSIRRPVNGTCSTLSTETAKQWLRTCLNEHRCSHWLEASRNEEQRQARPSRLVDVQSFDGNSMDVRLIDGSNVSKYVTLSYCWGRAPSFTTTSESLDQRTTRIRYEDLPGTFKDAVKITRDLGYRYIWIDALCIVQGSEEDWAREGSKMKDIFSNCVLCIAATSSVDVSSGCYAPGARGRQEIEPYLIDVPSVLSTGRRSTLWIYCEPAAHYTPGPDIPAVIRESPAATRGWILQERVLAPRILHFTAEQLVWECGEGFQSEDGLEEWYSGRSPHQTGPRLARQLANAEGTSSPFAIVQNWYHEIIAQDYSRRLLSVSEDKLPAISGLARLVARSTQSRYIAGLWEYGLCYGLCWKVNAPASPELRTTNYRAPSFSWASVDSQVDWLPMIFDVNIPPSSLLTILSWLSIPATSDEYGRVSLALLEVTGQVKLCRVTPCEAHKWPNDANAEILDARNRPLTLSQAWMDTAPIEESLLSMLICAVQEEFPGNDTWTIYALLLEPVTGRLGVFRRRGLASFHGSEAYDQTLLPGEYRNATITVI